MVNVAPLCAPRPPAPRYESDAEQAERFYYSQLGGCGPPPWPACNPNVARAVLQQHINCPSMLVVFPVQVGLCRTTCWRPWWAVGSHGSAAAVLVVPWALTCIMKQHIP